MKLPAGAVPAVYFYWRQNQVAGTRNFLLQNFKHTRQLLRRGVKVTQVRRRPHSKTMTSHAPHTLCVSPCSVWPWSAVRCFGQGFTLFPAKRGSDNLTRRWFFFPLECLSPRRARDQHIGVLLFGGSFVYRIFTNIHTIEKHDVYVNYYYCDGFITMQILLVGHWRNGVVM